MKSKSSQLIRKVAQKMGAEVKVILKERNFFSIKYKGRTFFVQTNFVINKIPSFGIQTTKFKDITYKLLKEAGISTPKAITFYEETPATEIKKKIKSLKMPLIIKQLEGSNSKDLFPNVTDLEKAAKIIESELKKVRKVIVQEMVKGKEYRILTLENKIIGALEMIPPCVYGDDKSTVKELIEKKQLKVEKEIKIDQDLKNVLKSQGLNLNSIPSKGSRVRLKDYSSLSSGGETADVISKVHPSFHKLGQGLCNTTNKNLCGADIICEDISKDIKKQKHYVLEVNGRPDLTIHYNPTHGKTQDVIKKVIEYLSNSKNYSR